MNNAKLIATAARNEFEKARQRNREIAQLLELTDPQPRRDDPRNTGVRVRRPDIADKPISSKRAS